MDITPTVDNAVAWFGAHTVTHHLDVVDRVDGFDRQHSYCRGLDCAILQRKRVRAHDVEVR
uniref:Uncharacterized protein n=1 Tax=Siphoviridae sp. ctjKY6 TaxID=2825631 RepID=A0A8S5UYE0_9CAUD|nr:MAG TPA: hypothetical protein [Siphoviridae sp. ctjKY6]